MGTYLCTYKVKNSLMIQSLNSIMNTIRSSENVMKLICLDIQSLLLSLWIKHKQKLFFAIGGRSIGMNGLP